MSYDTRAVARAMIVGTAVFALLVCGLPARRVLADGDPPPPATITVQAHVVMASKVKPKDASVDASLKEVAAMLKQGFMGRFNRFRRHDTVPANVALEKETTVFLIGKYYLRTKYRGAKVQADKSQMIDVTYTLVKRVKVTVDGKTKDKDILYPAVNYTVPRGKFVLIAGPKVGDETLVLTVRVQK